MLIAFTVIALLFLAIALGLFGIIVIPLSAEEFVGFTALEALAAGGHALPAAGGPGLVSVAAALIAGRAADECGLF